MAQGDRLVAERDYAGARAAYDQILDRYPQADLAPRARAARDVVAEILTGRAELARLRAEAATREADLARLRESLAARHGDLTRLHEDLAGRQAELERVRAELQTRQAELERLETIDPRLGRRR